MRYVDLPLHNRDSIAAVIVVGLRSINHIALLAYVRWLDVRSLFLRDAAIACVGAQSPVTYARLGCLMNACGRAPFSY